jgi:2-hydroxy-3-oxopropionate reductase
MKIAFLGTGLMGAPMALRLHAAKHDVTVWNRSPEKAQALAAHGLTVETDAASAAQSAGIVFTMLTDGAAVEDLMFARGVAQAMAGGGQGPLHVDMSSIAPVQARCISQRLSEMNVAALDAPVSGGTVGAREGTLAIMAGGDQAVFARALPLFDVLGRATLVGGPGAGQVAKLCNQQIVAITIGAVAEALHLAERAGADPAAMRTAIRGGFAESRILELHGQRMLARDFTPGGRSAVQLKDLDNILALAADSGTSTPLTLQMRQRFQRLVKELSCGDLDHSALLLELEDRTARSLD